MITPVLIQIFERDLTNVAQEISLYKDDASIWELKDGLPVTGGNLCLHIAGNLQHFIGTVLGGSGYVRNRDLEFGQRSGPRENVYAELDAAIAVVRRVLPSLPNERLEQEFPEQLMGMTFRTSTFLVHL